MPKEREKKKCFTSDLKKWINILNTDYELISIPQLQAALRGFESEWLALDLVLSSCTAIDVFPLQAAVFSAASSFWSVTLSRLSVLFR